MSAPNSRRNLDIAIQHLADEQGEPYIRTRSTIANTIVGQFMPEGVVKGGSAIKLRLGDGKTRFTTDFDVARTSSLDGFIEALRASLEKGWAGFTGRVAPREPAHPEGIPPQYVMMPFDIKLDYNGKAWCTIELEVGHNEIGDADEADWGISPDIVSMFERLELPEPEPVPLMPLHQQVAQKLHALSSPGSKRAHDLIDLQLLEASGQVDLLKALNTCQRLFAYRQAQPWPPSISVQSGWRDAYNEQRGDLPVLASVDEAVAWVNEFLRFISESESESNENK